MHAKSRVQTLKVHANPKSYVRRLVEPKKSTMIIIIFEFGFREQQQQPSRQEVGVGDESLQLASVFGSEIYLP